MTKDVREFVLYPTQLISLDNKLLPVLTFW